MKIFLTSAVCIALTILQTVCLKASDAPANLTVCDFLKNPLGQNLTDLRFNWQIPTTQEGSAQSAYRIVVFDPEKSGDEALWDSGKVESDKSVFVAYEGKELKSRQVALWKVKIWDENGRESDWSENAKFELGLLNNSDWQASWISSSKTPTPARGETQASVPPTYFRKTFELAKEVESARLYTACRGIFKIYINGEEVNNDYLSTGWTDYNKRIQSDTTDATKLLKPGKNAICAIVCDGWYSGRLAWADRRNFYGTKPELLCQLELKFKDGTRQVIASGADWKNSEGALKFASLYDGEEYDENFEKKNWNAPDFDDSDWQNANVSKLSDTPKIEPRRDTPVKVMMELPAISVKESGEGSFIFDFGQNLVGVAAIKIPAKKGMKIRLNFAEMLNKDGSLYTQNYRTARSQDEYVCARDGTVEWAPQFTFHGFRYMQISGLPADAKAELDWAKAKVIYNDLSLSGTFECSKPKVNALQHCIQWGQRGNFVSIPTDCPQRDERLGWTADAQVFLPTAAFNMDVSAFFFKWLQDLRDSQTPDGRFPHVSPDILGGGGSAAWSDGGVVCPWELYLAYGDEKVLRDNFEAMKKWVNYQKNTAKDLIRPANGFGDWLQPNGKGPGDCDCPKDLIGTAYFARCAEIVSKSAKILGFDEDAKAYAELARQVKEAYKKRFVEPDLRLKSDSQTAYLLTLAFDMLDEKDRTKVFEHLLKAIERSNFHLNTGFVGTPLINPVLTRFGRSDIAYRLLNNETYPSWLYPINQGATTMWERWNSYSHEKGFGNASMNSFNHYAYGAVGQWLYKDVAGLWYDETSPGYKNIIFAPKLGGGLTYARATKQTPYGLATSHWKIEGKDFIWEIQVPANSTANLTLPEGLESTTINLEPLPSRVAKLKSGSYEIRAKLRD